MKLHSQPNFEETADILFINKSDAFARESIRKKSL
jgi:hypothetical protein